ncbi:NAD(P)(+)--arginine ADP-ribosyltransferase 2-like [Onychostoma macrolepis]|uniref:NAD(P)(+)--arginine ADP-ribosyltransferase 2-like n=1 Tax=Onychostoma macrolepis TaxID=369639 RepID=UPI00272D8238|nr:NAD(P)(+)--arginine ADP-ribosyltransferase 2-like [Onychostoma macrolepis]XP_058620093.1 NAD(P)(+)--arginine ADP-ribosyltransferase 2-like [Onychostoma macrolepis]
MLLIIEALLLILAALGQDHGDAVEGQIFPLDMAPNSVDDQYKGCRKKMVNLVKTKYLKKELSNSDDFRNAWERGEKNVTHKFVNIFSKLTKQHKIAIWVYTDPKSKIYVKFNNDTRNGKQNYKDNTYKWYSLHFLLTDAIQILKKKQNRCFNTFRGTNVTFNGQVFTGIRFGSFTSSSNNSNVAKTFKTVSCFEIYTCEGADITKYSRLRHEAEVLIPPYEMFNVTDVKNRTDQPDLWCDTVFMLNSTGTRSDLNCALFKKPTKTIKYYGVH